MGIDSKILSVPNFDKSQVVKQGVAIIIKPALSVGASVLVDHNLGYIPVVFAYYTDQDLNNFSAIPYEEYTTTGLLSLSFVMAVSDTDLSIQAVSPDVAGTSVYDGSYTFYIRYYLLSLRVD